MYLLSMVIPRAPSALLPISFPARSVLLVFPLAPPFSPLASLLLFNTSTPLPALSVSLPEPTVPPQQYLLSLILPPFPAAYVFPGTTSPAGVPPSATAHHAYVSLPSATSAVPVPLSLSPRALLIPVPTPSACPMSLPIPPFLSTTVHHASVSFLSVSRDWCWRRHKRR